MSYAVPGHWEGGLTEAQGRLPGPQSWECVGARSSQRAQHVHPACGDESWRRGRWRHGHRLPGVDSGHRHNPAPQAWAVILSLESNSFAEFFPWSFSRIESDGIVFSQVRGNYYYKEQSARPARPVYRTPNSGCCVYRVLSTHATSSDEAPPTLAA